jgi:AraC family transcriptional regulator, carnitine catabolism transcriptional activator
MLSVSLILLPRFQMLAYVMATETLRIANKVAGTPIFRWQTLTADGAPVVASNGARSPADAGLGDRALDHDLVVVIAGYDPLAGLTKPMAAALRRAARRGQMLGGLDTGTMVLAYLGLLAGYRAVLHHEAEAGFRAQWPEIAISDTIYCLDRDRLTAAGGVSTGDAMLAWIARAVAQPLAEATSVAMIHGRIRRPEEPQRQVPQALARVVAAMQRALEAPIPIADLARIGGVSDRQLLRLFHAELGCTPSAHYLALRLNHARALVQGTRQPMRRIAADTGFASAAGFSTAFRGRFGLSPRQVRNLVRS